MFGYPRHHFAEVESTNLTARELAAHGARHGTLVSTDYQIGGKGRAGRKWHAQRGKNLLLSYIIEAGRPPEQCSLLPLLVSLAVADMIETATGLVAQLKWPNDIWIVSKKIGGVLLETMYSDAFRIVCGVGLNVNQEVFEGEYRTPPTSLKLQTGREYDREYLIECLNRCLTKWFRAWRQGEDRSICEQWKKRTFLLGKFVYVETGDTRSRVKVVDVESSGALVIVTDEGERETVFAGDITLMNEAG